MPIRNYCASQLFTAWHHLQQSTGMSVEEVALQMRISLESFMEVSKSLTFERMYFFPLQMLSGFDLLLL